MIARGCQQYPQDLGPRGNHVLIYQSSMAKRGTVPDGALACDAYLINSYGSTSDRRGMIIP